MKIFLNQAVDVCIDQNPNMHNDLVQSQRSNQDDTKRKLEKNFKEEESEKF